MAIQEVLVETGTLAKLLGTDLPPLLVVFYYLEVAPPSILAVVSRQDQCRQSGRAVCAFEKTYSSVSGCISESHISALQAWCLRSPRDGQRRSVVLRHTLSSAAT